MECSWDVFLESMGLVFKFKKREFVIVDLN